MDAKEYEVYLNSNDKYIDYLHLCLQYPHLDVFEERIDAPKKTPEIERQELMMFSILLAVFEHAHRTYASRTLRSEFERTEFENWKGYMGFWAKRPNFQAAWSKLYSDYESKFQEYMDALIPESQSEARISQEAIAEVETALSRYLSVVEKSGMAPTTKQTYSEHPRNFLRWMKGEFEPGRSLDGRGRRTDI